MIKIRDVEGFQLHYDECNKLFVLLDDTGDSVASDASQEALEQKAKALRREIFKPIAVMAIKSAGTFVGTVTSVNREDRTMRASLLEPGYDGKPRTVSTKVFLGVSEGTYYEQTPQNVGISQLIDVQRAIINTAREEIKKLRERLEKPIDREYFGLKR